MVCYDIVQSQNLDKYKRKINIYSFNWGEVPCHHASMRLIELISVGLRLWFLSMWALRADLVCLPTPITWRRPNVPLPAARPTRICMLLSAVYQRCRPPTPVHLCIRSNCASMSATISDHQRPRNSSWSHGAPTYRYWIRAWAQLCRSAHRSIASIWWFCQHCPVRCNGFHCC